MNEFAGLSDELTCLRPRDSYQRTGQNSLLTVFDSKQQVDVAILDVGKAFDTVPHDSFFNKTANYGDNGRLLSFLKHRLINVVEGEDSKCIEYGVPQGTVLGSLVFLSSYIRPNTQDHVTSRHVTSMYLCRRVSAVQIKQEHIQDSIHLQIYLLSLETWAEIWGMKFNARNANLDSKVPE